MAAEVIGSSNTILEVLNLYNYEDWSLRVETYLVAKGLWDDVVKARAKTPGDGEIEYRDWRIKNAEALYAIQNSCRTDVFRFICQIKMAKDAWETLEKRLKPKNIDIKGMVATLVPSEMIETLNQENYEHWSFWVKTYLVSEDLWDVVQVTSEPPKVKDREGETEHMAWRKMNARALHVIAIFCGEDAKSSIRDVERAKDAWNTLANKFKPADILLISVPALRQGEQGDRTTGHHSDGGIQAGVNFEVDSNDDTDSNDGNADLKREADEVYEYETYKPLFEKVWGNDKKDVSSKNKYLEDVKNFIKQYPEAVRAKESNYGGTILQCAILNRDVDVVKMLLAFMKKKDLDILDDEGYTALSFAIQYWESDDENKILKCIIDKNKKLLLRAVHPSSNTTPVLYALSLNRPKKASYLYSVTPLEKLKSRDAAELVSTGLRLGYLDIPLDLLRRFPHLAITKDHSGESPLNELARTRSGLFFNKRELGIWKRLIYSCIHIPPTPTPTHAPAPTGDIDVAISVPIEEKDQGNRKHLIGKVTSFFGRLVANLSRISGIDGIYQMKLLHIQAMEILSCTCDALRRDGQNNIYMQNKLFKKAFFQAVERGNMDFFIEVYLAMVATKNESWFLTITNEHDKTIFQFAAEYRQKKVFDLIHRKKLTEIIGRKDKFGNNVLHEAGRLSPLIQISHIRSAALQMQYELQWFKKVERMADPKDRNCINSYGRTPSEEFTKNHRDLVKEGEKSMKETATSSSALVAALIITIMFATIVTVPGGINGDTGIPIYLHTKSFRIFIVADVISLCSSTTSVMVFLGILTSRFAEEDFLTSLPTKLIIGFLTLFISIGAMMVAFASAIFIMLPETSSIVVSSIVLAGVPIASFLWMQLPFLLKIIISTYGLRNWVRGIYYSLDYFCYCLCKFFFLFFEKCKFFFLKR